VQRCGPSIPQRDVGLAGRKSARRLR
jgi:hypothetical protein